MRVSAPLTFPTQVVANGLPNQPYSNTFQAQGGFQNGAVNAYPKGIDWTTWDGKPAGYEGYLADSFRFLQAVLLREQKFRERLYRPLRASSESSSRPIQGKN